MIKQTKILLTCLIIGTSLYGDTGKLTKIIDGDTVKFDKNITCRLAYIDTPESSENKRLSKFLSKCSNVKMADMISAGKKSTSILKNHLTVGKEYTYQVNGTDHYGRKICEIYVNEKSVNYEMVKSGYALPFLQYIPKNISKEYKKANQHAKSTGSGLYSSHKNAIECLEGN